MDLAMPISYVLLGRPACGTNHLPHVLPRVCSAFMRKSPTALRSLPVFPEALGLDGGYDDAHRQPREAEDKGVTVEAGPHVCDYGEPQQREEQVLQEVR